jgi:hypothetical protein
MGAEWPSKLPLEFKGHKYVYSDYYWVETGGRGFRHFIVVHAAMPEFDKLRFHFQGGNRPSVQLSLGDRDYPLDDEGVYLVRQTGRFFLVKCIQKGHPAGDDKTSVEHFIIAALGG